MREYTATSDTSPFSGTDWLWSWRSNCWKTASPITPLSVKNIGCDKAKKKIEDSHYCTELCCAVLPEARVVYSKDDDVEQDTDAVDDQRQEDCVLAVWQGNAPDEAAKEQQVVDHIRQLCPSA